MQHIGKRFVHVVQHTWTLSVLHNHPLPSSTPLPQYSRHSLFCPVRAWSLGTFFVESSNIHEDAEAEKEWRTTTFCWKIVCAWKTFGSSSSQRTHVVALVVFVIAFTSYFIRMLLLLLRCFVIIADMRRWLHCKTHLANVQKHRHPLANANAVAIKTIQIQRQQCLRSIALSSAKFCVFWLFMLIYFLPLDVFIF